MMSATGLAILGPGRAMAQRPLGVDVSTYQGTGINWTSVKSDGVSFAWTRADEGTDIIDNTFTVNENNGKAAGVIMGAYHFAQPADNTPAAEATHFWNEAGGYIKADNLTLMPMLDMESLSTSDGAANLSDWANDWCADIVADALSGGVSVKPIIYVSACNACVFNTSVSQWGSDIADYNGENVFTGTPWSTCTSCEEWGPGVWNFWQVSSTGAISGISGNVDLDGFNGTSTSLSTWVATAGSSSIYYWDTQASGGANPYTGSMSGTWENNEWSTGSGGQASPTGWVNGKAACFGVHTGNGTPAFTVTMNSSHVVAGFFDGPLTPDSCNVTITGSGIIDLASGAQGLSVFDSTDGSDAFMTINNVIGGNGQAVIQGNGQLYLNGVNTYNGGTQLGYSSGSIFDGIANFNNSASFGTGTITLTTFGSGGALVAEGTSAITIPNNFTAANTTTNNFVGNTGGVTYSGNWSLGGNLLTLETGNAAGKIDIISGVISGSAGLTISDAGTLVMSGANTYSGTTTILSPAVLTIGDPGQLGSGSYGNSIVNGGTFNYSSTAAQTLSGVISGAGKLNLKGAGTLTLSAANTYTGATSVTAGELALGAGGSIASSAVTVSSGATLADLNTSGASAMGATTLNSGASLSFTAAGGSSTVGQISVSGNLALNNNPVTVNVTGSPLTTGTYKVMGCSGTLTGSANPTPAITGNGLAAGQFALVGTTPGAAGHVNLIVSALPSIQAAQLSGNSFAFTWNALTNQLYQIQATASLTPANWTNLGGTFNPTNSAMTLSEPIGSNSQQFYRVVLLP